MMKSIKCSLCNKQYATVDDYIAHLNKSHSEDIPKGWSAGHFYYYLKKGVDHGNCVVCKGPTGFNEKTLKYFRFCNNPKCKEKYREMFKKRMIGKYGKISLLDDPEQQKKMLANRSISGTYKWSDGSLKTYTGTYELSFLEFLDATMDFKSSDVITPSPHTYWYIYEGKKHFYIPDVFIPSLNLEIEIKDGGDNPNKHPKIQAVDKVKEKLKDDVMKSNGDNFDYIKIVNKQNDTFLKYLNLNKKRLEEDGTIRKPIFII